MNKKVVENLLTSELENVNGGSAGTCICENGGAGETVIIEVPPVPEDDPTKLV
ncbi:MAG: hypothetical protein IJZ42_00525 [Lachnospiraceae bacterium]|nr:hypothetical protein [Lachnospiraceae bacterium]